MGVSQSKKYTKSSSTPQIQLDYTKNVINELKILSNWSIQEIRQFCLAFKRYSFQCPYLSRFTFKKLLPLSDRISNQVFAYWTKGQKFLLFYQFFCGLVLLSFNTMKRKLQFLYLVFNFMHEQNIRLKHYLLMYECMAFAYCRLTGQGFPEFSMIKRYLYEEYLNSQSMEILEGAFDFRMLIEQVEKNNITRQLFKRFQGDVFGVKDKPSLFMLMGLAKYNKQEAEQIFKTIRNAYEEKDFKVVEENERRKKCRLDRRKASVLEQITADRELSLEKTRDFRIKNRSYSFKNFEGLGSKIVFNGNDACGVSSGKGFSSTGYALSPCKEPMGLQSHNSSILFKTIKNTPQKLNNLSKKDEIQIRDFEQKSQQLTSRKLTNVKLSKLSPTKKSSAVVFLGGRAYTKTDFFGTIEYFNSLSNGKEEIRMKQFFKTFENKAFMKRQLYTLFRFFDKNLNGSISFEQFIKTTYPNIDSQLMSRLSEWNIDYKNIYQADKIFIKKENKKVKIELPEDATDRIKEMFFSFGGAKGYLNFQDIRAAYTAGFSLQECENIVKEYGVEGKIFLEGFGRMLLPEDFVIENCDWHIKRTEKSVTLVSP